ncbi:hypothetical protein K7X08_037578 [Anisodus acutangulus]|uniref:Uncharacterized protein n=1 Tax=Anisodus acutangulus TaxID=402998 RepID=A0A9Q1MWX4_9SOLA|nr:hypothetical protein K7X08_037578 [Anisodus acutangulus]
MAKARGRPRKNKGDKHASGFRRGGSSLIEDLRIAVSFRVLVTVMKVDFGEIQPSRTYQTDSSSFYPEKFPKERRSIIPAGDTSQFIQSRDADIAILEEPEHLNWYHHGKRWSDNFNHVVGIVRTNYLEYVKREKNGSLQASLVKHINNWATRAYCDKYSPKFLICNVHGVNPKGRDDADDSLHGVALCTAMAGALAMGNIGPPIE